METGSLRDELAANIDIVESGGDLNAPRDAPPLDAEVSHETAPTETAEQKAGRTANRLRDEQGRLLPGTKEVAAPATPTPPIAAAPTAAPVAVTPTIARPSSWKKDYWDKFDGIAQSDPQLAQYLVEREQQFASGVSTYKAEAESAKQLNEAIAPFMPQLQQHGIEPTQWIRNLGTAHERLAMGAPHEKVGMAVKLIQDYGIDPQALFQAISNPNYQPPAPPQPTYNPQQIAQTVQEQVAAALTQREIQSEFQKFTTAKDAAGNPMYPHYEQVKETMAGLLQAELAQDYKSAYEAALRHPRHADIWNAQQEQLAAQKEAERLAATKAVVTRARSNAVSVKTATPSGSPSAGNGTKSLRESLSEAIDAAADSRV